MYFIVGLVIGYVICWKQDFIVTKVKALYNLIMDKINSKKTPSA